jgi:Flp pilus assembly protein TadG
MRSNKSRRGNSLIEFTFVGIPLMFALVSIFEISRGMWIYHTLAYSIKEGTRFAMVKGMNCRAPGNSCATSVAQVAQRIKDSGIGLDPSVLNVQMTSVTQTVTCNPLNTCLSQTTTYWPNSSTTGTPDLGSSVGRPLQMTASYRFTSAIAMFWPGAPGGGAVSFSAVTLWAKTQEQIYF